MLKNKNILITGINGFIGDNLNEHFKKNNKIYGVTREKSIKIRDKKIILSHVNKLSLGKIPISPDYIFHCAGGSSVTKSLKDPKKDYQDTVKATKCILDFYKNKIKKKPIIYFFSSAAVYGNTKNRLKPISPYGKNKLIAENLCLRYSKKYDYKVVILRLYSVYGNGLKKQLFWDICNKIKINNNNNYFGSGNEKRSWVNIKDLISAINLLLKVKKKIIKIDIGSLNPIKNKKIINIFYKYFKIGLKPKFDNVVRKGDPKNQISKNKQIKNIGWKPKIKIDSGIKSYANWFKKN
jgi:UDP-glucose 4-epimerase